LKNRSYEYFLIIHTGMKPPKMNNVNSMPKKNVIENMINLITQHSYFDRNHYYQSGVQFTSLNHYGTLKVK